MLQKQFSCFSTFYSQIILISRKLICKPKSLQECVFLDKMGAVNIFLAACTEEAETVLVGAFEALRTEERWIRGYLEAQTSELRIVD